MRIDLGDCGTVHLKIIMATTSIANFETENAISICPYERYCCDTKANPGVRGCCNDARRGQRISLDDTGYAGSG